MRIPQPISLIWFPTWSCQFYTRGKSHGDNCPYCPLGLTADGVESRVLVDGVPRGLNSPRSVETTTRIIDFLNANATILNRYVSLSGGEPLVCPFLSEVLKATGFQWSITSNSQNRIVMERLEEGGLLAKCRGWTCSYHPLADRDAMYRDNLQYLASKLPCPIYLTLVISVQTIPVLRRAVEFIKTLPIHGFQFHLDSHPQDTKVTAEQLRAAAINQLEGDLGFMPPIYAGRVPQGVNCDRFGVSMGLSPNGTLFECVTKTHLDLDPVCQVDAKTDLAALQQRPIRVQRCDVACFACCDHGKHVGG